jgi:serine/threonine protein kinase
VIFVHKKTKTDFFPSKEIIQEMSRLIGSGTTGNVYEVNNGYVIKKCIDENSFNGILIESAILVHCNHPNIVTIKQLYLTNDDLLSIKMPNCGDPLDKWIILNRDNEDYKTRVPKIIRQIISGVKYLHIHGIIHRDLSSTNILVDTNDFVTIIDFGTSKYAGNIGKKFEYKNKIQSARYRSPESRRKQSYNHLVDVYSLGVIIYELTVGKVGIFNVANKKEKMNELGKLAMSEDVNSLLKSLKIVDRPNICELSFEKVPLYRLNEIVVEHNVNIIEFDDQLYETFHTAMRIIVDYYLSATFDTVFCLLEILRKVHGKTEKIIESCVDLAYIFTVDEPYKILVSDRELIMEIFVLLKGKLIFPTLVTFIDSVDKKLELLTNLYYKDESIPKSELFSKLCALLS